MPAPDRPSLTEPGPARAVWSRAYPQWASAGVLLAGWLLVTWGLQPQSAAVGLACQALSGVLLSAWLRLPIWWWAINAVFPVALHGAVALHWSPLVFLGAFLVLTLIYWTTFSTRVPLYASGPAVWRLMARCLPPQSGARVVDLGSGLGGLALHLAHQPGAPAVLGLELAPLPWLLSCWRARWRRSACRFRRQDYRCHDLSSYDLVLAYLSPAAMPTLWQQLVSQLKPGACFISCEFAVPDQAAVALPGSGQDGVPPLYVWRMGADGALLAGLGPELEAVFLKDLPCS